MINQVFDDDATEDDIDEMMDAGTPVEVVTERPAGQFSRDLANRTVWFKAPIPGQFTAFRRYRETLARRYEVLAVRARKTKSVEMLNELRELADRIDLSTLEFFEALLADQDDVDFIAMEMIGGRITMEQIHSVMFGDIGPEDDEEPVKKDKPVRKAANAKRTKR